MKNSEIDPERKDHVSIYSVPVEEEAATDFALTVNEHPVFTHRARVSSHPFNQVWPGYQRPLTQTEIASFASWDMAGPVDVTIVSARPVKEVRVRPQSAGIKVVVEGNTIRFRMEKPGQLTVEVNGTHSALHLFANPLEQNLPDFTDPKVRYFGPGIHCPGIIRLESHQTVYLAPGAVVYGSIFAEKADHITVSGRGILDGSKFDRMDVPALICLVDCKHVRLEGITLRDPSSWTLVPVTCQHVHIHNIKLIGNWRYNTDGIDFVNCAHCVLEDSFIRAFDDCIVLKGFRKWGPFIYKLQLLDGRWDGVFTFDGVTPLTVAELHRDYGTYECDLPIKDIKVRRCVVWNEWGRALEIGAETVASEISDILFEDCDILHTGHVAMDVQNSDRARCKNIVFRNIRVEMDDDLTPPMLQTKKGETYRANPGERANPRLIVLEIVKGWCSHDAERGHIEDVRFENIEVTSWSMPTSNLLGYDEEHLVKNITIEGLRINGKTVSSFEEAGFAEAKFARDITVKS